MASWLQIIALFIIAYVLFINVIKRVAHTYLPRILKFMMPRMHLKLRNLKTKLFEEAFEKVDTNNKSGKLEILELFIRTGENFKCFPPNSNITILDNNDRFLPVLQDSINQHRKDLTISKLIVNSAEKMSSIESNSMDVVVHTFMLCSVPDSNSALKEIYRVLKPGGVFIFIDHAVEHENLFRKIVQKLMEPMMTECKFIDIHEVLENGPFDQLVVKKYTELDGFFSNFNPIVYGYGLKLKKN